MSKHFFSLSKIVYFSHRALFVISMFSKFIVLHESKISFFWSPLLSVQQWIGSNQMVLVIFLVLLLHRCSDFISAPQQQQQIVMRKIGADYLQPRQARQCNLCTAPCVARGGGKCGQHQETGKFGMCLQFLTISDICNHFKLPKLLSCQTCCHQESSPFPDHFIPHDSHLLVEI